MKKLFFFVIASICSIIFVIHQVQFNPKSIKGANKKIEEYLENKYSETFTNIEFCETIQNTKRTAMDKSKIWDKKIKNSYKHYYKVFSKENNLEFYVIYEKIKGKKGKKIENFYDTYSSFKKIKDDASKLLEKIDELGLSDITGNFHVERTSQYIYTYMPSVYKGNDAIKELSEISEVRHKFTAYFKDANEQTSGDTTYTFFCFKINLKLDEVIDKYQEQITLLSELIRQMEVENKNKVNLMIMTDDNFVLTTSQSSKKNVSILVYSIRSNDYDEIDKSLEAFYNSKTE